VEGHAVSLHVKPSEVEAGSRASIAVTPIPKLDGSVNGNGGTPLARIPRVDETECVGCNLCSLVCPVEDCITMVEVATGKTAETWAERTSGECAPPALNQH
jgi:dihydropyrimidine dehydrogenase (NAD+) subunit PreA